MKGRLEEAAELLGEGRTDQAVGEIKQAAEEAIDKVKQSEK